jgi:2,3-diketo-5-methylthio-1-phosphopentane phosphatase
MLLRFSVDERWVDLEKKWQKGKIGSRECLQGQIEGMRITQKALDRYLSKIRLDPYFKKLIRLLNSRRIKVIILSDNFDYILKRIFTNNRIRNLRIYSNKARFSKDRLVLRFPFADKDCQICAHCKKRSLLTNVNREVLSIYIGDGLSDVCPSQYANIVFAKGSLLRHLKNKRLSCVPYKTLRDVYGYFRKSLV